ncbi:MAG: anti-sigma factor [Gemmatimonadota bacterium]
MSAPGWLRIKCQHAHVLLSARMDRAPVGNWDRFRLWLHLRFCDFCSRVERQMAFMREAMRRIDR